MNPAYVSVVLQGAAEADPVATERAIASVRRTLPGAPIILSTWTDPAPRTFAVDLSLRSEDPGPLPRLKKNSDVPNNINRQITSTAAGLRRVETPYALKMRVDACLTGDGFLRRQRECPDRDPGAAVFRERVVVSNLLTLNPRVVEQLPFHVSDWFHFGRTEDLLRIWDGPLMSVADATWFAARPHRPGSTTLDRRFNPRFACEQWVMRNALGADRFACFNDARAEVLRAHDAFLAHNLVIVDHGRDGFSLPKKDWAARSLYYRFACYSHADWCDLYRRHGGRAPNLPRASRGRRLAQAGLAALRRARLGPAWPRA